MADQPLLRTSAVITHITLHEALKTVADLLPHVDPANLSATHRTGLAAYIDEVHEEIHAFKQRVFATQQPSKKSEK